MNNRSTEVGVWQVGRVFTDSASDAEYLAERLGEGPELIVIHEGIIAVVDVLAETINWNPVPRFCDVEELTGNLIAGLLWGKKSTESLMLIFCNLQGEPIFSVPAYSDDVDMDDFLQNVTNYCNPYEKRQGDS